jgi:hypothetical protein
VGVASITVVLALNDPLGGGVHITFEPLFDAATTVLE